MGFRCSADEQYWVLFHSGESDPEILRQPDWDICNNKRLVPVIGSRTEIINGHPREVCLLQGDARRRLARGRSILESHSDGVARIDRI